MYVLHTALSPSITNTSKQNNHNMSSFFKSQFCDRVVFGVPRFLGCIHLYIGLEEEEEMYLTHFQWHHKGE